MKLLRDSVVIVLFTLKGISFLSFFYSYVFFSSFESETYPTTQCQFDLAKVLAQELTELGVEDVSISKHCIVTGTIPSNCADKRVMGIISHMDVSPDAPAQNVKPTLHLVTPELQHNGLVLGEDVVIPWNQLKRYVGDYIISSDGTTLVFHFLSLFLFLAWC